MFIGLHAKYPLFLSGFNETLTSERFSGEKKCSNIKFRENPLGGGRIIACGQTDRHDEANSRFFAIFANAPKP